MMWCCGCVEAHLCEERRAVRGIKADVLAANIDVMELCVSRNSRCVKGQGNR